MRYRLTHIDGPWPNFALMTIAYHLRLRGNECFLSRSVERTQEDRPTDTVVASALFTHKRRRLDAFRKNFPNATIGGPAIENSQTVQQLLNIEEKHNIDYTLYPDFALSIGYTSRGCRFRCPFCLTHRQEKQIRSTTTLQQIWRQNGHERKLVLLDPDFLGQPLWKDRCEEAIAGKFHISLNQGINIRTITPEQANLLARMSLHDPDFTRRRLTTAFDNPRDTDAFTRGMHTLIDAGFARSAIRVYMLIGYWPGEKAEDLVERLNTITDFGAHPYPMIFGQRTHQLRTFQRWAVRRLYHHSPFTDYLAAHPQRIRENRHQKHRPDR